MTKTKKTKRTALGYWGLILIAFLISGCSKSDPQPNGDPSASPNRPVISEENDGGIKRIVGNASYFDFLQSGKIVVIDFGAKWCGPCQELLPEMEKMADEFTERGVQFGMVDYDNNEQLCKAQGVEGIPDIRIFVNGEQAAQTIGCNPEKIREDLERVLNDAEFNAEEGSESNEEMTEGEELVIPFDESDNASDGPESEASAENEASEDGSAEGHSESAAPESVNAPRIQSISSPEAYNAAIASASVVVVDFNATWCGPCQKLAPYLERMAENFAKNGVKFYSADVDDFERSFMREMKITGIPDVRIYVNGQPFDGVVGYEPMTIMEKIEKAVESAQ